MSKIKMIFIPVLVIFLAPVLLEYFIFRNNVYSVLNNGEWGSFLGSYIGGLFGGIGTLIAVYITTKETRKIQEENSEQINRKERKLFTDGLSEDIAKYIAYIENYIFLSCNKNLLYIKKDNMEKELSDIEKLIKNEQCKNIDINSDFNEYIKSEQKQDILKDEKLSLQYKIQDILAEIKLNVPDKTMVNKYYFIIKIKLKNIELGNNIIEQLENMHIKYSFIDGKDYNNIIKETEKLLNLTVEFIDEYINSTN